MAMDGRASGLFCPRARSLVRADDNRAFSHGHLLSSHQVAEARAHEMEAAAKKKEQEASALQVQVRRIMRDPHI